MKAIIKRLSSVAYMLSMACLMVSLTACADEQTTYAWPDRWTENDDVKDKPRVLWVDAAANFGDYSTNKDNIARDLALAAESGFTAVVVDVRPDNGDVLFQTTHGDQVEWLGGWVEGTYTKFPWSNEWDYLEAFIEAGQDLGLKVYAGFNTFVGGKYYSYLSEYAGPLYNGTMDKSWATTLNTTNGLVSAVDANDTTYGTKFFNPANTEVQEYICDLLVDLATNYPDLDGIIFDRCRYDSISSDFSDETLSQLKDYIGIESDIAITDILPVGHDSYVLPSPAPTYMAKWLEFRAKTIHDFVVKASTAIRAANADIEVGAYVGGWYSTYYDVGVNWASPTFNPKSESRYTSWVTDKYMEYGYADHMDIMLIGAYATPGNIYGSSEWSMEGFCSLAAVKIGSDGPIVVGGPDVGNWDASGAYTETQEEEAVTKSVDACYNACGGYFLFDMIHLKLYDYWDEVKSGIDAVLAEEAE